MARTAADIQDHSARGAGRAQPTRFQRVVAPWDFSRTSGRALTRAVLHVLPRALPAPLDREAEAIARRRIARAVALRRPRLRGLEGL